MQKKLEELLTIKRTQSKSFGWKYFGLNSFELLGRQKDTMARQISTWYYWPLTMNEWVYINVIFHQVAAQVPDEKLYVLILM